MLPKPHGFYPTTAFFLCVKAGVSLGAQLAAGFRGKGIKLIKVMAKILLPLAGHLSLCHDGLEVPAPIPPAPGFRDQILAQKRGWGSLVI